MRLLYFLQQMLIGTYNICLLLGPEQGLSATPGARSSRPHGASGLGFRLEHRL